MRTLARVLAPAGACVLAATGCAGTVYDTLDGGTATADAGGTVVRDAGSAGGGGMGSGGSAGGAPASGKCTVPAEAALEDVSKPTTVVGTGTAASCTSAAFVAAVAKGGVITFSCGASPVTITLDETAKVFNDKPKVVIDGGGKVTLSGGKKRRILYQNTCDQAQLWTTPNCNDQATPALTVQNLTFRDGNAKGDSSHDGGGAIYARGGRLKVIDSRFLGNVCDDVGPDVGGGAIRTFDQHQDKPVYVVRSVFGAEGAGNVCSNGGALSSIGVSFTVIDSVFAHNQAIGNGANPPEGDSPGGGSGGAIYNDGNTYKLSICGSTIEHNDANEGGGAIFYVSNDRSGTLAISHSTFRDNPSEGFETEGLPGMFVLAKETPAITSSTADGEPL